MSKLPPSDTLSADLRDLQSFQFIQLASAVALVYDTLILSGEEVEYVWRSRWTWPKGLHLLSRISPFADTIVNIYHIFVFPQPSDETCTTLFSLLGWSMTIGMALSEIVMILRVYVLYQKSRRVLYSLGLLWIILFFIAAIFIEKASLEVQFVHFIHGEDHGCPSTVESIGQSLSVAFIALFTMETVIVCLTIYHALSSRFEAYEVAGYDSLLWILYVDGGLFFIVLAGLPPSVSASIQEYNKESTALDILNVIFLRSLQNRGALASALITPMRTIHSLLSCRMLLDIRQANARRTHNIFPSALRLVDNSVPAHNDSQDITSWIPVYKPSMSALSLSQPSFSFDSYSTTTPCSFG